MCRGWCQMHYVRWRNHGDPLTVQTRVGENRGAHPLYSRFRAMHGRCENPNNSGYKDYGAKGITVCERWSGVEGFTNFCEDMGPCPPGYTLDRRKNDLGYSPENCRWTDASTQQHNRGVQSRNKSGVTGVHFDNTFQKWKAEIMVNRKRILLGYFTDKQEAIDARRRAEKKHLQG